MTKVETVGLYEEHISHEFETRRGRDDRGVGWDNLYVNRHLTLSRESVLESAEP